MGRFTPAWPKFPLFDDTTFCTFRHTAISDHMVMGTRKETFAARGNAQQLLWDICAAPAAGAARFFGFELGGDRLHVAADGHVHHNCKAGDGVADIQLIADLHKSEVFAVGRLLGVPDAILAAPPSADLWEGQTDEDELGFGYDFVELYTELLAMGADRARELLAPLSPAAAAEFRRLGDMCHGVHRRNRHKETYPININALAVPKLEGRVTPPE
eukprot:gnl/Chilomastix_cuspidata/5622.p2 GENE.gnl/Chilomastix_cuspidata/5622~~gnl/Chilomastix_cuspidata/5622.p2  ORF type:complete len:215 (+),score=115.85 gnl/Chilomastix_cuspidata/5622:219-863(+)